MSKECIHFLGHSVYVNLVILILSICSYCCSVNTNFSVMNIICPKTVHSDILLQLLFIKSAMENKRQFLCNFWHGKTTTGSELFGIFTSFYGICTSSAYFTESQNCQDVMSVNWTQFINPHNKGLQNLYGDSL